MWLLVPLICMVWPSCSQSAQRSRRTNLSVDDTSSLSSQSISPYGSWSSFEKKSSRPQTKLQQLFNPLNKVCYMHVCVCIYLYMIHRGHKYGAKKWLNLQSWITSVLFFAMQDSTKVYCRINIRSDRISYISGCKIAWCECFFSREYNKIYVGADWLTVETGDPGLNPLTKICLHVPKINWMVTSALCEKL